MSMNEPIRIAPSALASLGLIRIVENAMRGRDAAQRLQMPTGRVLTVLPLSRHTAFWQANPQLFRKDPGQKGTAAYLTREVLGHTLLSTNDADWPAMRHEMTHLLATARDWFQRPLAGATTTLADGLDSGNLLDLCVAWSMRAICDPLLGTGALDNAAHALVLALNDGFVARVEGAPAHARLEARFSAFLKQVAQDRGEDSIAARVTEHNDAAALRAVVGGILVGSLHINALSLFWLLVQVAGQPALQDDIAAEAIPFAGLPRRVPETPLAFATLREAQRLRPVMAFIERQVTADMQIDDLTLLAGETVLFSPWFAHRDADAWPDPLRFDPARFMPGGHVSRAAHLPYGIGPRICPGANLTNQQLTYALSEICRRTRFSLSPQTRPGHLGHIYRVNLEPRGAVHLTTQTRPTLAHQQEAAHAVRPF